MTAPWKFLFQNLIESLESLLPPDRLEPDDDRGICLRCNVAVSCDDGCDPTPWCHHCAQQATEEIRGQLDESKKTVAAYRAER